LKNLIDLSGRTIVVTGAGQGIGRALSELALSLGANVAGIDLNREGLAVLAGMGEGRFMPLVGSVSDPGHVTASVAAILERYGAIHGLVNNAGITRPALIEKMTLEQWQEVIDVHLTGSFLWLQAVGRMMIHRIKAGDSTGGSIVNVSSDAGRRGSFGQINYSTAKAGVLGFTMSAAREWGKYGIRTNSVSYGVVETPMTETIRGEKFRDSVIAQLPMGRWAQPEEVVRTVCFLLSDASSYILGQHISVTGGSHMAS